MKDLLTWLRNHELINIRKLERKCGIPQAALAKALKETMPIADKHKPILIQELKKYGFKN